MKNLALFLSAASCLVSLVEAQPKLSIDPPDVDLGVIYSGAIKKGHATLKNIGNQPLKILNLQSSCGCTTVKRPKDVLQPNESDRIEFEFNSLGFHGRVEKSLYIATNDPSTEYFAIKVFGEVRTELEPANRTTLTWFGSIPIDQNTTQNIVFRNASGRTLTITGTGATVPSITVRIDKKTITPADSVVAAVTVRPKKVGYVNERFWLEIDSKNQPRVDMRVSFIGIKP